LLRNNLEMCTALAVMEQTSFSWAINGELIGSHRVDGGHEAFGDAKVVVENFNNRGQAVSCARS